jgi:hypothetical protein
MSTRVKWKVCMVGTERPNPRRFEAEARVKIEYSAHSRIVTSHGRRASPDAQRRLITKSRNPQCDVGRSSRSRLMPADP